MSAAKVKLFIMECSHVDILPHKGHAAELFELTATKVMLLYCSS